MIKQFKGRRNGKTWSETVSDASMPSRSVAEVKANYAGATNIKIVNRAQYVAGTTSQTELSKNVRQAFREMLSERGLKSLYALSAMSQEKFEDYLDTL